MYISGVPRSARNRRYFHSTTKVWPRNHAERALKLGAVRRRLQRGGPLRMGTARQAFSTPGAWGHGSRNRQPTARQAHPQFALRGNIRINSFITIA